MSADYYYAGGQKISLSLDTERVAVDFSRAGRGSQKLLKELVSAKPLTGRVKLIERKNLSPKTIAALEKDKALLPVYRHGDAFIVVLPEVRVELAQGQRSRLEAMVQEGSIKTAIEEDRSGRVVLRPTSGKGTDALALAARLHETVHPVMAEPRFLRMVRKP